MTTLRGYGEPLQLDTSATPAARRGEAPAAVDIDCAENQGFVHGVANIPALGFFVPGTRVKSVIGMRPPELRLAFDELLSSAAGGSPVQRFREKGILSVIRRLISRQRGSG
jgi:hypothetical protein